MKGLEGQDGATLEGNRGQNKAEAEGRKRQYRADWKGTKSLIHLASFFGSSDLLAGQTMVLCL